MGFGAATTLPCFNCAKSCNFQILKLLYTTFVNIQSAGAATSFQLTAWLCAQAICWEAIRQHRWVVLASTLLYHVSLWYQEEQRSSSGRLTSTGPSDNKQQQYQAIRQHRWVIAESS